MTKRKRVHPVHLVRSKGEWRVVDYRGHIIAAFSHLVAAQLWCDLRGYEVAP